MSNFSAASTAYTPVEATRRTLAPMPITAQLAQAKKPMRFSEPMKDYVRRAFQPENFIDGITRSEMEVKLKKTLTDAIETGQEFEIDWTSLPYPQHMIQQDRAYHLSRQPPWSQPASADLFAPPVTRDISTNTKKRSFIDQSDIARGSAPPWRNTAHTGALESRITHSSKSSMTRAEKKQKKAQALEPSSKFQETLDHRARRFKLDNSPPAKSRAWSSHDEQQANGPSGPVVGTCQEVFKGYFRLTRAPRPSEVRPQTVVEETLRRLKVLWRKENNYNYICDQLKSIRQDLTVQHIKNSFTVEVYQTHALIALEKGDLGEYNQCQTQLRALYSMNLGGRPAEFTAYRILYFIHTANRTGLNEILAELTSIDKTQPAIKHALDVRSAVGSGDYNKLFRLYLDCPNMGAYLMDMFVARERTFALAIMCTGYKTTKISTQFLAEELGFDSYEDCLRFLEQSLPKEGPSYLLPNDEGKMCLDSKAGAHFEAQKKSFERVDIKGQI